MPLQNIHPLGLGEFAGAAGAVALGVVALGAGHRRREPFFQPRRVPERELHCVAMSAIALTRGSRLKAGTTG